MTQTVHLAAVNAAVAALQHLTDVPSARVYADRAVPFDQADCPAVNVVCDGARFDAFSGGDDAQGRGVLRAVLGLRVRIHTKGEAHTAAADPIIAQVHAAIMADPGLGGLAWRLQLVETRPQQAPHDGGVGIWELAYHITAAVLEDTMQPCGAA